MDDGMTLPCDHCIPFLQDAVAAAILAVNLGAVLALVYPLAAPYLAQAAKGVATAVHRCCSQPGRAPSLAGGL